MPLTDGAHRGTDGWRKPHLVVGSFGAGAVIGIKVTQTAQRQAHRTGVPTGRKALQPSVAAHPFGCGKVAAQGGMGIVGGIGQGDVVRKVALHSGGEVNFALIVLLAGSSYGNGGVVMGIMAFCQSYLAAAKALHALFCQVQRACPKACCSVSCSLLSLTYSTTGPGKRR